MRSRLFLALSAYAVLGVMAGLTLEGNVRLAVFILLGGLAVKTWLAGISHSQR